MFCQDYGRGTRNRTKIYGFGDRYTSRCTMPLYLYSSTKMFLWLAEMQMNFGYHKKDLTLYAKVCYDRYNESSGV